MMSPRAVAIATEQAIDAAARTLFKTLDAHQAFGFVPSSNADFIIGQIATIIRDGLIELVEEDVGAML